MAGRILVLDDEENYAEMLQDLLRGHNYQVDMATRPERAIDQLEEIPYDLVISDYKMPVLDGADFLKKARQLYPNLPFILVSGLMNTPELVKVANMSVTLVMEKPLDTTAFLSHVARFAEPMSSEEMEALSLEPVSDGTQDAPEVFIYPEEPRFFSAGCVASKKFMQDVWNVSLVGSHVFILEPKGGDAALAVKDLSVWRGNLDKPIEALVFEDLIAAGADKIKELLAHEEHSNVIVVRLSSSDQISQAKEHLEQTIQEVTGSEDVFFAYLLEASSSEQSFGELAGAAGCVLPELCERPTDVAHYARRFARLVAERSAKPKAASFTPEVVYAVLAFEWPGNYQQIQEVVSAAVKQSEDAPVRMDALEEALGSVAGLRPEARLGALMQKVQARRFSALLAAGESVEALARRLELSSNPQSEDDLRNLPLVNSRVANL